MKLIPLDITTIRNNWPYYIDGIKRCVRFTKSDIDYASVKNEIWSGNVLMFDCEYQGENVGFIAVRTMGAPFCDKSLLIYLCYAKKQISDELYLEAFKELDRFAKFYGCKTIEFYTMRDKAFERKLTDKGWKAKYVIFQRDVAWSQEVKEVQ